PVAPESGSPAPRARPWRSPARAARGGSRSAGAAARDPPPEDCQARTSCRPARAAPDAIGRSTPATLRVARSGSHAPSHPARASGSRSGAGAAASSPRHPWPRARAWTSATGRAPAPTRRRARRERSTLRSSQRGSSVWTSPFPPVLVGQSSFRLPGLFVTRERSSGARYRIGPGGGGGGAPGGGGGGGGGGGAGWGGYGHGDEAWAVGV